MPWAVENFKPFKKNTLRGFFSLNIGGMTIEGFTLHEKNGKRWVGYPSKQYADENGDDQWWPLIKFKDKAKRYKFQDWARAEVLKAAKAVDTETEPLEDDDLAF